jgi:ferric-dicitrate binding protein FerR (iron transport regulator)
MKMKPIVVVVLSLIVCLPVCAETAAQINVGKGDVRVKSIYGAWRNVKEGESIHKGSQIQVGQEARCDLIIGGKNVVRLEPGTLLKIRSLDPIRLEMPDGELFAHVKKIKKGSTFQVKTPTAIASVRGTGWRQSAKEISVFEGQVQVDGAADEAILLSAGSSVEISETGAVGEPEPIEETETSEWEDFEMASQKTLIQFENTATNSDTPGGNESGSVNEEANEPVSANPSESSVSNAPNPSDTVIVADVEPVQNADQKETESAETANALNFEESES